MAEKKLTKREYLGIGYIHQFRKNDTGETLLVQCTEEEYNKLGQKDGSKFNPVQPGYTWECSFGGTYKVDTPSTLLGEDEYCIVGEDAVIILSGKPVFERMKVVSKNEVIDDRIETDIWQLQ